MKTYTLVENTNKDCHLQGLNPLASTWKVPQSELENAACVLHSIQLPQKISVFCTKKRVHFFRGDMVNRHAKLEFNNKKSRVGQSCTRSATARTSSWSSCQLSHSNNPPKCFSKFRSCNDGNDLKRLFDRTEMPMRATAHLFMSSWFERQKTTIISLINEGTKTSFI